jgi:TetR/AcrR family transcriptional regulator, transcriptional repressor of bet genes
VIIREGLEATTLRDISREGGFTTGVLTHYFPDKQALIAGTFAATSRAWIAQARAALSAAVTVPELLSAFVAVAVPRDPERRAEWRLWAEMWTYAGRDRAFVAELEAADALWEQEIRAMLGRVRDEGLLPAGLDLDIEAAVLARLVDGLGLRAWLSGAWEPARNLLIGHLASLGLPVRVVAGLAAEGAGVPA